MTINVLYAIVALSLACATWACALLCAFDAISKLVRRTATRRTILRDAGKALFFIALTAISSTMAVLVLLSGT